MRKVTLSTQSLLFVAAFLLNLSLLFSSPSQQRLWSDRPWVSQLISCDLFNWTLPETLPFPPVLKNLTSPESVFAFVHLRKCGGSTIRSFLWRDFRSAGLNEQNSICIFACTGKVWCETTSPYYWKDYIENKLTLPVHLIGHFPYPEVATVLKARPSAQIHCLSSLRLPEERFVSCLYYRTSEQKNAQNISNFTPSTLETFAEEFRDINGFGCSNELLRMFADETDESVLNHLNLHLYDQGVRLMETAKRNMEQCIFLVPGRDEENEAIARHWFPTLPGLIQARDKAINMWMKPTEEIPAEMADTIFLLTQLETILYNYGVQLHDRQYSYVLEQTTILDTTSSTMN
eukprot:TRINITY_DN2187_c0_g1_i1.p1 TRINITY_DN2187_c0_g1~~TRINITY_DN2187_c0_g1_i1.p1  ORF type:complete len:346 (-),score=36.44 TRINITY_DN2187_c0_g1_i1:32-1069(-)